MSEKPAKKIPNSFILKTFQMLDKDKFDRIIRWTSEGLSFIIIDLDAFNNTVLPLYFKHKNISTFVRQLNMYGFHKISDQSLEFSHPLFQKSDKSLLIRIYRKTVEVPAAKEKHPDLGKSLAKFRLQHDKMENMIKSLETRYDTIVEQNQTMVQELMQSKQREKNIEAYNEKTNQENEQKRKEKSQDDDFNYFDSDEYLKFSPLNFEN